MNKTALIASTILAALFIQGLAACATAPAIAQEQSAPSAAVAETVALTITVRGVREGRGPVMLALFDSEAGWRGHGRPVRSSNIDAAASDVTVTFQGLPAGTYGVKLYQDLDGNGEMNTNPFGIPSEPYGFSNDAPVRFGPPSWEDARFTALTAVAAHTINLP